MTGAPIQKNCPPTVAAAEGRCTALEAGAKAAYETRRTAGKRFQWSPVLTGNNSHSGVPDAVSTARNRDATQSVEKDQLVWVWPRQGGEVRANVSLYKGSRFLDIRWWFEKPGGHGPSQKGATIPLEAIEDLGKALIAFAASKQL